MFKLVYIDPHRPKRIKKSPLVSLSTQASAGFTLSTQVNARLTPGPHKWDII